MTNRDSSPTDLQALVCECLNALDEGGPAALERVLDRHPDAAPEVRERLTLLHDRGLLEEPQRDEFPERLGDFRLIERIGGGGMGIVYRAEQTSLEREVALKLIRPERLFFPGARERFRREVESIARLSHPNIVPIYTVGEERDVPYFAMECIEGPSLAEVLRALADRRPETVDGDALAPLFECAPDAQAGLAGSDWTEIVLRWVAEVAHALAHAHARGVLHRDVKPSNVLICADGRALLSDFGLASSSGGDSITQTGSMVGSLPYLAPEILRGDEPSERGDVYSLGVTLYELLALTPPFAGRNAEVLRGRILAGEPRGLRERNHAVSWDIETVCAKALELAPQRRYDHAAAFARDLENLLARRPIEARRAPLALRVQRWAQRRPARAVAAVLLPVTLIVGPLTWALVERSASARVEAGLDLALESVESMLARFGDADVARLPVVRSLQLELMTEAHRMLGELAALRSPGRERDALHLQRARLEIAMAEACLDLARPAEGLAWTERYVDTFTAATGLAPTVRWPELARGHNGRANQLHAMGRFDEALAAYGDALGPALAYASLEVDDEGWLSVSVIERNRARLLWDEGDLRAAAAAAEAAIAAAERAPEQPAIAVERLRALGRARSQRALLASDAGDPEAYAVGARALDALERALSLAPDDTVALLDSIEIAMSQAELSKAVGRPGEAESILADALERARYLVDAQPDVPGHRYWIATVQSNLAIVAAGSGRLERARALQAEAVAAFEGLCVVAPDTGDRESDLARALINLASMGYTDGRHDEAARDLERALQLHAGRPTDPRLVPVRAKGLLTRANLEQARGNYLAAEATLGEVRRLPREGLDPDRLDSDRMVVELWVDCANAAADDFDLPRDERLARVERYLDEAEAAADRAFEHGYRDVDRWRANRALEKLFERPSFQLRLERLAGPE